MAASSRPAPLPDAVRSHLLDGQVIPAHPLALTAGRRLDERHQRALTRYYVAAGAGGIAVGVHTTQFAIREPRHGLYEPVLALAAATARASLATAPRPFALVAGIVGETPQAVAEAQLARELGYHAGLLSLAALGDASRDALLAHCRAVAAEIPLFGFYLQPAVGGRVLDYGFWRAFAEIERVVAIKIAPFDRYATLDVVRAVADSGRRDVALYTGNDDSIVADLLSRFPSADGSASLVMHGGLLGHWAVWTRAAVDLFAQIRQARGSGVISPELLARSTEVTDMNGALFDVRHRFAGCIPGVHEILRRQGLMQGAWCLDPAECLSPGQSEELDRVTRSYPHLTDDQFVAEHREEWLAP
jgi:dihydrodipicolinate synthase/N-acetylneuraminate lyase